MNKNIEWAIEKLKDLVKESHIKGQMHIDLSLSTADQRETYLQALFIVRSEISEGTITEQDFKIRVGLI